MKVKAGFFAKIDLKIRLAGVGMLKKNSLLLQSLFYVVDRTIQALPY
jgi:hypothetical protein